MFRINSSISLLNRSKKTFALALAVLLPVILLSGCGYTLKGQGSFLPEHIKSIMIPELRNRTPKLELEQVITRKIQEELISRGTYSLADSKDDAGAILEATIMEYKTTPKSINSEGRATSYTITIRLDVKFRDLVENKVLFEDNNYSVSEEYQLTDAEEDFLDQEEFAIEEAAIKLSEKLISAILEGF